MGSYMYRFEHVFMQETLKSSAMMPGDRRGLLGREYIVRRKERKRPRR